LSRAGQANNLYRWTAAALAFAVLFTSGYVISKVRAGYRQHLDGLARFGEQVRQQAAARHLRYAAVSAPAESLVLYLRQTHFLLPSVFCLPSSSDCPVLVLWSRSPVVLLFVL